MKKEVLIKLLMEKLSDTTLKRLLDGNEETINRFLNLSHSQQKLLTESSPEILNEFTNMLNLVNRETTQLMEHLGLKN